MTTVPYLSTIQLMFLINDRLQHIVDLVYSKRQQLLAPSPPPIRVGASRRIVYNYGLSLIKESCMSLNKVSSGEIDADKESAVIFVDHVTNSAHPQL